MAPGIHPRRLPVSFRRRSWKGKCCFGGAGGFYEYPPRGFIWTDNTNNNKGPTVAASAALAADNAAIVALVLIILARIFMM